MQEKVGLYASTYINNMLEFVMYTIHTPGFKCNASKKSNVDVEVRALRHGKRAERLKFI